MKKLIFLIPLLFIFCGCANYNELNNLAIVTGLAIDKDGDNYIVSILIPNSSTAEESSKEGNSQTVIYDGKGDTLSTALKDIDLKSPKSLYLGHLAVVVVSEEIAKEDMSCITDYFFRNPETTKRFFLVVARDTKASDVLTIMTPLESFSSRNIAINIKNSNEKEAISVDVTFSKFVENFLKKGINPVLPTITVNGDVKKGSTNANLEKALPDAIVKLGSLALFKDDKFLGYSIDDESRGINIVNNEIKEMIISTNCGKNNHIITYISELSTKHKIKFENGEPVVYVKTKATGDIQEITCKVNLNKNEEIKKIKNEVDNKMEKLMYQGINVAKNYRTDVFGFGNLVYKKDYKYFNKIKNWDEKFIDLKVIIDVDINLEYKGSLEQSIKESKNE